MDSNSQPKLSSHQLKKKARLLEDLRREAEINYEQYALTSMVRHPLTLPLKSPLPLVTYDHLQDLCNKPTAIYMKAGKQLHIHREDIKDYICDKWTRGNIHTTNVEFYRNFAKVIAFETPEGEIPGPKDILALHKSLIARLEETRPKFDTCGREEALYGGLVDHLIYNPENRRHFKIKPLFRDLVIVLEGPAGNNVADFPVTLVRTSTSSFNFAKLGKENDVAITVSLAEVVRFVMDLDEQEPDYQDYNALAYHYAKVREAEARGFTRGDIVGPSTTWIKGPSVRS